MIRRLYRFLRGVLVVSVQGKNVARFLNLCTGSGIVVWNVTSVDAWQVQMCIYLSDIYQLKQFRRKTHVHLRIQKRMGLPFLLGRYRARKVFAGVIIGMIAVLSVLSTKIWRIEVIGNASIGEETLVEYLKAQEITYGVSKSQIDNDALELSLRQDFDAIIWASVYEKGTKLVVSVQEKIISDRPEAPGSICTDLVADRDAKITSIVTRRGLAAVKAGDTVKAGDILVCGRQEILDDNGEVKEYYYQSADADVMGQVVYDYEDWIPETVMSMQHTGNVRNAYYITFGEKQIFFPMIFAQYDDYETLEDIRQLRLMDSFYLPVFLGHIEYLEQRVVETTRTESDVKNIALKNFGQFLDDLEENGVSILDKNVMMEKVGDRYHIYGKVSASERITATALTEVLPQPKEAKQDDEE